MSWKKGEKYKCLHEDCACEIVVEKGPSKEEAAGDRNPVCCCGQEMEKQ